MSSIPQTSPPVHRTCSMTAQRLQHTIYWRDMFLARKARVNASHRSGLARRNAIRCARDFLAMAREGRIEPIN